MPKGLQAEALLLLPHMLLSPSRPSQAAGLLVRCLGHPHPPPPALRLPLLHALNLLDVPGPLAGDVAGMLEQVCPHSIMSPAVRASQVWRIRGEGVLCLKILLEQVCPLSTGVLATSASTPVCRTSRTVPAA